MNYAVRSTRKIARFVLNVGIALAATGVFCRPLAARNVDLSTVPTRDTVQLTIYNSEDLTLVRETRTVTFKKGSNPLQFSWAGTLIDPTSVELKFLSKAEQLDVLDTTFPHDKPQMLYWNVESEFDGEAKIEISYFTSGITWSADYLCIADINEQNVGLEGFVRVYNRSGEEYEDAQIRLVVGTINLVEKIAQLARMPVSRLGELSKADFSFYKQAAGRAAMVTNGPVAADAFAQSEEKQIIKEGLSEYFIFTVEGTETIPNGWSKRMRSLESTAVPLKVEYRYRPQQYGDQLVRVFVLTNDKPSKLGESPLPDGMVRVFRINGRDGLSYLTEQSVKYIPIGDKIELNLGPNPEVIFELVKLRTRRDNIWMYVGPAQVLRKVDDGTLKIDVNSTVAGWDDHEVYVQRIRNYTRKDIQVEVRRALDGDVTLRSKLDAKLHDYRTVELKTTVPAAQKAEMRFEVVRGQGRNSKQNRITLDAGEVGR